MTETMNVHKALCELKTLDARIAKETRESVFVFAKKHSTTKVSGVDVSKYCDEVTKTFQSVTDLINRRDAIKRAVTKSNAVTEVVIGAKTYTVAEAIETKNHGMQYKRDLLSKLEADYRRAQREADANNGDVLEDRADEYVRSLYGNTDMKNAGEDAKKSRSDFIAAQTVEVVDPVKVKEKMTVLTNEIESFMVDVDSALSVSNALTEITIDY